MKKIQASPKKIKYENPRYIQLFSKTVLAMLEGQPTPKVDFPINVFGMKFQTFLLTTEMKDVISAKRVDYELWLHEHLDDTLHEKIIFFHPGLVSKAGTIAPQIEKRARIIVDRLIDSKLADLIFLPYNPRFHWVLAVIDLKSQTVYYLDLLLQQPY
ncbi:hypothetical protein AAG906_007565 [Vitis piasezkii]